MDDVQKFEASMETVKQAKWQKNIKTFKDLEDSYKQSLIQSATHRLDFSNWIPSMAGKVRPLFSGEVCTVLADTGGGKTAFIQNVVLKAAGSLKTLFFEMELPDSLMAERFIAISSKIVAQDVERSFQEGNPIKYGNEFDHISFYTEGLVSFDEIREIIDFKKPQLVILDYIGLIQSKGTNRYERMSYLAEQIKVIAKASNTIILVACQIHRKGDEASKEIFLHDAKDSGSIENSSGLMFGVWREGDDLSEMKVKVCKNTKGVPGYIFPCIFNGANLDIRPAPYNPLKVKA